MSIKLTPPFILNDDGTFNKTFEEALQILRRRRDLELQKTDIYFLSDTTKLTTTEEKSQLKIKRQALRDITDGVSTIEQVLKKINTI